MNSEIIYTKTASGDEAMHQRTRVMQRNVRMVLILVDGQSTVADLTLKTGNQKLIENALHELEKGGFVEALVEQDSLWAEGKKVAQEIRAAAIDKALKFSSSRTKDSQRGLEPSLPESPISMHSAFSTSSRGGASISQLSFEPIQPMQYGRVVGEQSSSVFSQQGSKNNNETQLMSADESRFTFFDRFKAILPKANRKEITASIKPIHRGQRNSWGWSAIIMSVFLVVLGFAFLIVSFFPFNSYLPKLEAAFSQASGRPVKVGSMRVDVYPKAGLFLGDVHIGSGDHELRIAGIRLLPAIGSLMTSNIRFRELVLSGVTLSTESILGLSDVFVTLTKPTVGFGIELIGFEQTEVLFDGLGFSGMQGEAKMSSNGQFQSLLLRSTDRNLSLEVTPQEQRLDISLEGLGWRPHQGSLFIFDSINLKGIIEKGAFTISNMELHLFDGLIRGSAVLGGDKQPSISGKLNFERVSAVKFGEALGIGSQFIGETAGTIDFSASSDSWSAIFSAIHADGEFSIRRGSVQGIDFAEAMRRVSTKPVEGGKTVFEQFSGKIRLTPTDYQFSGLIMNSGLMQSTGRIDVSKDLKISGKMELQMRGTVNQTRVPVLINGPLKNPTVQIGK